MGVLAIDNAEDVLVETDHLKHASSLPIMTPPLTYDSTQEAYSGIDQKQAGMLTRVLEILKGIKLGSDITKLQVPPQFNLPKSQLQLYGEMAYSFGEDILSECVSAVSPLERMLMVLKWHISTTRPAPFGKAPYNPVLGETHHVSAGSLNVLVEQVSHHPPVSMLYASDEAKKIKTLWRHRPVPRFYGSSVMAHIDGRRCLILEEFGETYEMTSPDLVFRFFPNPGTEWLGDCYIRCVESGFEAKVCFKSRTMFGLRGSRTRVCGSVFKSGSSEALYEFKGNYDQTVMLEEKQSGTKSVLYDMKAALKDMRVPVIDNFQNVSPMESVRIWSRVTKSILGQEWQQAREVKSEIEEKQRKLRRERERTDETWTPQYFSRTNIVTSKSKGGKDSSLYEWDWALKDKLVPVAPISVPLK